MANTIRREINQNSSEFEERSYKNIQRQPEKEHVPARITAHKEPVLFLTAVSSTKLGCFSERALRKPAICFYN